MKVVYRDHAVSRMIERRLTPQEIEHVLFFADGIIKQSKDKAIYYKKMRGRKDNLIAVVAVKKNDNFEVVTVMVRFEVTHDTKNHP